MMTPRRRAVVDIVVITAAVAAATVPWSSGFVERWFSAGVYPFIQRVLTGASNLMPVPWLDVALVGALVWGGRLWWSAVRTQGVPSRRLRMARALLRTASGVALMFLLFLGIWGLNYRRVPLEQRLALDASEPSTSDVVALGFDAAAEANSLYQRAHTVGWRTDVWRDPSLLLAAAEVQRGLGRDAPAVPARLKRSLLGWLFRWNGVDAMTNPFGLEVLANPDLLPFERPFVAAHEWGHLAGFAVESEANFVGWLICLRADVPAQYSGWLYLYSQIRAELPFEARSDVDAALDDGPRQDLAAISARLRQGELPRLRTASWSAYDAYLRANRVASGVQSYGEVVTLILRTRAREGGLPGLRVEH